MRCSPVSNVACNLVTNHPKDGSRLLGFMICKCIWILENHAQDMKRLTSHTASEKAILTHLIDSRFVTVWGGAFDAVVNLQGEGIRASSLRTMSLQLGRAPLDHVHLFD